MKTRSMYGLVWVLIVSTSSFAATLRVPQQFPTIQSALDAASNGDIVLVDSGTYLGDSNRNLDFMGKSITLQSISGHSETIIDCENLARAFIFHLGENAAAQIDGFTIRNGSAGYQNGGAISITNASPTITNCVFENSHAFWGGAIYCTQASPVVSHCDFVQNQADQDGGALAITNESSPLISFSTFTENVAGYSSGAVFNIGVSAPEITSCLFTSNTAGLYGGALSYYHDSSGTVEGCIFAENETADAGGAIFFFDSYPLIGGSIDSMNTFTDNQSCDGSDLSVLGEVTSPIEASYNSFSGFHLSDYYVSPQTAFDLTGCESELTPIQQDVFVDDSGSDQNDGLSWSTPFLTIRHALAHVHGSISNPVTIHVGAGTYRLYTNGERYPIPILRNTIIQGISKYETILDAQNLSRLIIGTADDNVMIAGLTFQNGSAESGGAILLRGGSSPLITDVIFVSNWAEKGGAVCSLQSSPVITDAVIKHNDALFDGGGFYCFGGEPVLTNCLFHGNTGNEGGAIYCLNDVPPLTIMNCTIYGNSATDSGGGIYCTGAPMAAGNCIVWDNIPDGINSIESDFIDCVYSDVQSDDPPVYPGEGNINSDPLFVYPDFDVFYLSQTAAGQPAQSVCLNSGSGPASGICYPDEAGVVCLDSRTTRTDGIPDESLVDMGYHYESSPYETPAPTSTATGVRTPTPTATSTQTVTNTPLATSTPTFTRTPSPTPSASTTPSRTPTTSPTPTSTPTRIPALGVRIELPTTMVHPQDPFFVRGILDNPSDPMDDVPVFFILDVYGSYWFWPSWTHYTPGSTQIDFAVYDVETGSTQITVLPEFVWPDTGGDTVGGLLFYGAMLNEQMNAIRGEMAAVEWGYGP